MSADVTAWLTFARENVKAAAVLASEGLYLASLNNAQQAVEKSLKALLLARGLTPPRTHSIERLISLLDAAESIPCGGEDIDFLDVIYLPSKYPLEGVFPAFAPRRTDAERAVSLARAILAWVLSELPS